MTDGLFHGMDRHTGAALTGRGHVAQSIGDILTTPIGSRVMRRTYGSHLFTLIDQPGTPDKQQRLIAAATDALHRWEPRLRLERITVAIQFNGKVDMHVTGKIASGEDLQTSLTLIRGSVAA